MLSSYAQTRLTDAFARGKTGGKGYLQIKTARIRIHVERLAAKIQAAYFSATHRPGIDLGNVYPARSDDTLFDGTKRNRSQGKTFKRFNQFFPLRSRHGMHRHVRIATAFRNYGQYQFFRQQFDKRVAQLLI